MQMFIIGFAILFSLCLHAQDQANVKISSPTSLKCEPSESYLLNEISQMKKTKNMSSLLIIFQPFPKLLVKRSCIDSALQQVTAGRDLSEKEKSAGGRKKYAANNFIRCDSQNKLSTFQESPCQTQDSITLIHNSFETVTQCLKDFVSDSDDISIQNEWVKLYFKMLSKESGFQNYVKSNQNALGASQLTPQYVRDFIQFSMNDAQVHLKNSKYSVCRRLGEEILSAQAINNFAKKKSNGGYSFNTCSFIGANNNQILRNLLIGFSNLKVIKERVQRSIFFNNTIRLSPKDEVAVELALIPLAYNMGNGNLNSTIERAIRNQKSISNAKQLIDLVQKQIPFEETRNYLSNIDKRFASVVEDSGHKSCFN